VCRDEDLLFKAAIAEFEAIRPDAIVVGLDVYNVEAEAAGCGITFAEGRDTSIPGLTPGKEVLAGGQPPGSLAVPDPSHAGRMPLRISATERVHKQIGAHVPVMGAVSGPFSLAAALMGPTNLFMAMASEPEAARSVIELSVRVVIRYAAAYAARGIMTVVFDSQASPRLISPRNYRDFVLGPTKSVIEALKSGGMSHVPLVVGGNTDSIVDAYLETGGNYLLCDGPSSTERFLPACRAARRSFRRNIPSDFLASASVLEIRERTRKEKAGAGGYPGFIMGTGVVPYGIATEKIIAVRDALLLPS
jgi:uroporphyrinogen decarboxylase